MTVVRVSAIVVVLGIANVWPPPATAETQSVDATAEGVVIDRTGAVVAGATVRLTNLESGIVRSTTTDAAGRYRTPLVPAGTYDLRVEHTGFRPQVVPRQLLHVGTTTIVNVALETVAAAETVDVVAGAQLVEPASHALSRLVRSEEIATLPVVDRNFNSLALLAPGVTPNGKYGGVEINGSRDFQNGYVVDGVSAEGLGAGEQRVRFAQDWIQEFQVLTSRYNAEFGRASGGVLNAITRSGSNTYSGRVYGFFRNQAWDATPTFARTKPSLVSKRIGATAGGRLRRDRIFFFSGFEWFDDETSRVVNTTFSELNGNVPETSDQKVYLLKLEGHGRGVDSFRLRHNGENRNAANLGVGGRVTEEQGVALEYRANDLIGGWNTLLSASAFNELRGAISTSRDDRQCNYAERNPPGTWFTLQYVGAWLRCPGTGFGLKKSRELQVVENFSWMRGAHDFKAGIQLSHARSAGDFRFLRDGIYMFTHTNRFDLANPSSYPFSFVRFEGATAWSYPRWTWGLFVQDAWRLKPNLTVNAGVRYDVDGSYAALNRLIPAGSGREGVRHDRDNIAPRGGLTWALREGRTVVRGGAGIYHDENHSNVATLLLSNALLVNRSMLLNAMTPESFPNGAAGLSRFLAEALARNTVPEMVAVGPTVVLDPRLQIPYSAQVSGGVMQALRWGVSASIDGVYVRGIDQYSIRDVNLDRAAALLESPGRIVRLDPRYGAINRYGNDGRFEYRALQLQGTLAPRPRHVVRLSYTLSKNESNSRTALEGAAPGEGATNPFDLSEDFGPADHDLRHNLSVNWVTTLPLGLQLSGIVYARSAPPWSVATRQLPRTEDPDPFVDRVEPRNSRRGDGFFSLDARLSKVIRVQGRRAAAFVEAFNATNQTNFTGYLNNSLSPATFGHPSSAFERRRIQLGLRLDF